MSNYRVASRYSKSLLELAIESNKLEKVKTDMEMFINLCQECRPFLNFIKNPIIHVYKKLAVLQKLFEHRVDELTYKFIDIITRKGREDILPEIGQQFLQEYRIFKKIEIVDVTAPIKLDEDLKRKFMALSSKIVGENKKVELKEHIDEDLLGGYILKIGDRQIDDSVASKLRDLKKKLIVS
jgi:F-type H+-transporting ATPase subunit delta